MSNPPPAARLRADYDPERLRAEMRAIGHSRFAAQRTYSPDLQPSSETEADWRVLPLRSPSGSTERTDPGGPGLDEYDYTRYAADAPYMSAILAALPTRLRSARLMSLGPGAKVDEHRDYPYGLPAGWVRLHAPVVTNPGAVLTLAGTRHTWQPGTLWYGDFSQPHSVVNTGNTRRVHLVVDAYVNRALLELFPDEFVSGIRWSDVVFDHDEVPLGHADRAALVSRFDFPAAFLWGEKEELGVPGQRLHPAEVRVGYDDELYLDVDGVTRARLVHFGENEFTLAGGTLECTVKFDPAAERVRFRRRYGSRFFESVHHCRAAVPAAV